MLSLAVFFLSACGNLPIKQDPNIIYKKDVLWCIKNQACYRGLGVVPYAQEYRLEVNPTKKGKIDRIVFNSCHRNKGFYPQSKDLKTISGFKKFWNNLWGSKPDDLKGFEYLYTPTAGDLENSTKCPLYIFILDSESEAHSWSVMIIRHPKYKLKGLLYCDGESFTDTVTACEGRVGTIQRIRFNKPVSIEVRSIPLPTSSDGGSVIDGNCQMPRRIKSGYYEFELNKGACTYLFRTEQDEYHALITWAYDGLRFKQGGMR